MSFDHGISLFTAAMSFAGLMFVALQIRDATRQRESASLVEIYDINRQLLSLGFSHPKLFEILEDSKQADPVLERYYLQLWLNQLSLVHSYLNRSFVTAEVKESLERDIAYFMALQNMQRHWKRFRQFYPTSFQKFVDGIVSDMEPPPSALSAS